MRKLVSFLPIAGAVCLTVFFAISAEAATLRIGSAMMKYETPVVIPVELETGSGQAPAALSFDVTFDSEWLNVVDVEAGTSALSAGKTVSFEPFTGGVHILVGGVNENEMAPAELVLISIEVDRMQQLAVALAGDNGSAAAGDATRVPIAFVGGNLTPAPPGTPVLGIGTIVGLLLFAIVFTLRRRRSLLVMVAAVLLTLPTAATAMVAGDVDNSGDVTVTDLDLVVKVIMGGTVPYSTDIDFDDATDAVDYQLVVRALLGRDIDTDGDGLSNAAEENLGTRFDDPDSDNDGLNDTDEIESYETDPLDSDSDDDGLNDGDEVNTWNTDPHNPDTDGDTITDGDEVDMGVDPTVPTLPLTINEFVAKNDSGLQDEDGSYSDWIELYNPSQETAVNLDGWSLTDDAASPHKWTFPSINIGPNGYLVVFASGKDRKPTDGGNLHTNFRLSKDGEHLALVKPDSATNNLGYSYDFPAQHADVSYGLYNAEQRYFSHPTPGAPNDPGFTGYVAEPQFSQPHGFYNTPISVELTCETDGAQIRYTLDGSPPTPTTGTVYVEGIPISITETTSVRAAAFKAGYEDSAVVTSTYIFLDGVIHQPILPPGFPATWGGPPSSNILIDGDYEMDPEVVTDPAYADKMTDAMTQIPTVSLSMPVADWFSPETGIISNSALNDQPGWERACSAELIYPDGSQGFSINCGVRVVGGTSTSKNFKSPKHSLRLKFKSEYGPTRLTVDKPLFPGSPQTSFNTLVLDARLNMTWYHSFSEYQRAHAQYIRDQYINDMQNLLGDLSPHGFYAHVYLNGLYWGLYCVHERPDDAFMSDYLGGKPEDYDVIKHKLISSNVVAGSLTDYSAMFDLARTGMADQTAYETLISQYLDLNPFINYMLLNFWGGNTDWARHNWYVGRNRNDGSLFRYYSWDAEHVLKENDDDVTTMNNIGAPTELHQLLKENSVYRIKFGDRAHKLLKNGGLFTQGPAAAAYNARANEIYDAIIGESARWGDYRRDIRGDSTAELYTRDDWWIPELNRILNDYLLNRADIVINQLRAQHLYPVTEAPVYNINGTYQHGGVISSGAALTIDNPNGSGTIYYTLDGTDPLVPETGTVSATARNYSTDPPGPLTDTTRVLARVLDGTDWSALNDAVYQIDSSDYGGLRITEIMYDPAEPDGSSYWNNNDFEFIEVKNTGAYTLDLTGVSFTDGIHFTFNNSSIEEPQLLAPGEYIVVAKNELAFRSRYGDGIYVAGSYFGSLNNGGEHIRLADPAGATIIEFDYNGAWFEITEGHGFSLTAMDETEPDATVWNSKDGWRPSSEVGGTPGEGDILTIPAPGAVVINEVLAHSHDAAPDWIELYNTTGAPINLGGWFLSDNNADLKKFEIPLGTVIDAGGYKVFFEDQDFGAPNPRTPFALSENGETVYLSSGIAGELTGYAEEEDFGASETGVTFGRYFKSSTGTYNFVAMSENTPGAANSYPLVGPIVISEIMYHPEDAPSGNPDAEYIELYNLESTPVTLQDADTGVTWRITDGVEFTFPHNTVIPANGRLLLVLDLVAFTAEYPGVTVPVFQWDSGRLSNGGERVQLGKPGDVDSTGHLQYIRVDRVNYDDTAPWPTSADAGGDSLHRKVLSDYGNDVANWQAGAPTPGS